MLCMKKECLVSQRKRHTCFHRIPIALIEFLLTSRTSSLLDYVIYDVIDDITCYTKYILDKIH